jgi:hypothetical protein
MPNQPTAVQIELARKLETIQRYIQAHPIPKPTIETYKRTFAHKIANPVKPDALGD